MMKKSFVLSLILSVFVSSNIAQETLIYTHQDILFSQGRELFNQRKFAASYRNFEEFLQKTPITKAGQIQEAQYYIAANAYEMRQFEAAQKLKDYLEKYPYSPFIDKANLMLGMLEFDKKKYASALTYFNQVDSKRLGKREKEDFLFTKGYALLETKNYQQALAIFKGLKNKKTRYNLSATYYYAYSEYCLGNYAAALPDFLSIEDNPTYKNIVPYYIIQIYYAQKEYDKLYERADLLLKSNPDNKNNAEIYRIMGEIAYGKNEFQKAIDFFKQYESISPQVLRSDMYLTGLSYYQTNNWANTIQYLSKVTTDKDEMTENAYLHIGNAYVKQNDKTNARLAYEAALRTNFNKTIREEALYNYAISTYETTSAFAESIKAFEQFLSEFPNSKYINNAYDYLATVYMTSKNYEAAYQSIIKIKNPNSKLIETKQYLLYQIGTQYFAQNNYIKAIENFSLSLQSSSTGKYSSECLYWRSESYYRTNQPDKSIADLKLFFNNSNSGESVNYKIANYAMGYAFFSQKNYSEALRWFLKYKDLAKNSKETTYADALNRIGDCYFNARNFAEADSYYAQASSVSPNTGDYALFQSAYVAGLQKNYTTKINRLESLISTYPKSEYIDDALYEMGRAYVMLENNSKAIFTYQKLLSLEPNSPLARKAALEIGLIYTNQNNYDQAIAAYKKVIKDYPGSVESYTALESLESVYIEKNDVASYLAYTKTLNMSIGNNSKSREDSISYIAAEKQYMNANYPQAISGMRSYLTNYCGGGRFCANAQFYLADSYYRTNDKVNALSAYQAVLLIPGNQFMKEATSRSAEISYDKKDYSAAMQYFKQLQYLAENSDDRNIARLGVLRSSYYLNDHQNTLNIANEIINDSKSTTELKLEAQYNRAKAYIALNQPTQALTDLKITSADTRTAYGAESKYLLANLYFEQGKLVEAEKEVNDFAKKNTPYQYWLARSFVLLSDVYILQNNDFQAKQYLLSLQKNYTTVDDIQTLIAERLNKITQRENQRVIN